MHFSSYGAISRISFSYQWLHNIWFNDPLHWNYCLRLYYILEKHPLLYIPYTDCRVFIININYPLEIIFEYILVYSWPLYSLGISVANPCVFGNPCVTLDSRNLIAHSLLLTEGLPWWLSGEEPSCQNRRCRFDPWVRKFPGSRNCQPIPVFLPGKSCGWRNLVGCSPWGRKKVRHNLAAKQQLLSQTLLKQSQFTHILCVICIIYCS